MGHLYNREAVIKALIAKSLPTEYSHIRSLKDIRTLQFAKRPNVAEVDKKNGNDFPFMCPITYEEFNGLTSFYCIWTHSTDKKVNIPAVVLSEKGMQQLMKGSNNDLNVFIAEQTNDNSFLQKTIDVTDRIKLLPYLEEDVNNQKLLLLAHRKWIKNGFMKDNSEEVQHSLISHQSQDIDGVTSKQDDINSNPISSTTAISSNTNSKSKVTDKNTNNTNNTQDNHIHKSKKVSINSSINNSHSNVIMKDVYNSIQSQSNTSNNTYKSLFHTSAIDGNVNKSEKDMLFIGTSGLRYSIT